MPRILVINPNSSERVTAEIDAAVEPFRRDGGPTIDVMRLAEGPPGIQSQIHVDSVVMPLVNAVLTNPADAYVIACYSDPGLHAAREATKSPVLGIAECGLLTSLTLGTRFGVISILQTSIPRHLRHVASMGITDRMAGDRAIGLGVADLADAATTYARMADVGAQLRDLDGADVLVMGCAGMARHRAALAAALGIPVVEPTQAAVAMAVGRLTLGW